MAAKIDWEQFSTEAEAVAFLKAEKADTCSTTEQAKQYIRKNRPNASYSQDKIIKHIHALIPSAFVWKAAAGPYSRQGIPDVCAVINGRYYGFEVKRPLIGVLSAIQEQTIRQIKAAGGRAYVVSFPAEVTEILKKEAEV